MLEALAAGVPVIATDYGGNTDYLDASCGFPIPYSLIATDQAEYIYTPEHLGSPAFWADPDLSYAQAALEQIVADKSAYQKLADAARRRYEQRAATFSSLEWLAPLELEMPCLATR